MLYYIHSFRHGHVTDMLQAFPAIYTWMTYPLTMLLDLIWSAGHSSNQLPRVKDIELCSIAERALNFIHMGNTSVLLSRLMKPLWTSLGLLRDGWPSFNPRLVHFNDKKSLDILIKRWPFDEKKRVPISSAYAG